MRLCGWPALTALALLVGGPLLAQDRTAPPSGRDCFGEASSDRILRHEAGGEILLGSGTRIRLADLRLAEPERGETGRRLRSWLDTLGGLAVTVRRAGPPDRWNRVPAALDLAEGRGATLDIAEFLVAEGWAAVDAGERDRLCRPALLAAEAQARARRIGLWGPAGFPVAAGDPEALKALDGRFAVVEGRIRSVGERRDRTYLNFGRDFSRDFAATVPRRLWAAMKRDGISPEALRGRLVRVRGVVEIRRAPTLEITAAEMLEWRQAGPARP